jgi:putative MATE family efflux protein
MKSGTDLTEGPVGRHLVRMTLPMIGGIFAIYAFIITDTWFISRLGTQALAAISFTFPAVMVMGATAMGLGMGSASCIARALGEGDSSKVRLLTTNSLLLAMAVVATIGVAGLLTIRPLFTLMGASPDLVPLIRQYMLIYYSTAAVLVLPMMGNQALRATGDTLTPGLIMVVAAVANVILDPILIFGLLGAPRMELAGAALASAISRSLALVTTLTFLHRRHLLHWARPRFRPLWASWKDICGIGFPAALTNLLGAITSGILLWMVAQFGKEAAAGLGAGTRIETIIHVLPMALGSVLIPLAGQNWGANRRDRVRRAWTLATRFGIGWGLFTFLLAMVAAEPAARLFSQDPEVVRVIVLYLRYALLGSAGNFVTLYASFILNALDKPLTSAALNSIRMFGLSLPLAYLGSRTYGLVGLMAGTILGSVIAGIAVYPWMSHILSAENGD